MTTKKTAQNQRARVAAARSARAKADAVAADADRPARGNYLLYGVLAVMTLTTVVMLVVSQMSKDEKAKDQPGSVMADAGPVEVTGAALPKGDGSADDPGLGLKLPTFSGTGLDGKPLAIEPDGRAKLVVYLAHWCPHCQREVPELVKWMQAGELPDDLDVVGVTTSIDAGAPNYPPTDWLVGEKWTAPTLIDTDNAAAQASGLSSFPYFVVTDGEGIVVARGSGELGLDDLLQLVAPATAGPRGSS